ncbi:MAG: hypothetical protein ACI85Z_001138, partial [Rheinheimera aquimaris]
MLGNVFGRASICAAGLKTNNFELFSKIMELTLKPVS